MRGRNRRGGMFFIIFILIVVVLSLIYTKDLSEDIKNNIYLFAIALIIISLIFSGRR